MQDEDRQTREVFDAVTGERMASAPPRVEDQALVPRSEAGQGLDLREFARPSFESALERFRSAGQVDVDPEDPALFNAYRRSIDYLGDMALGGLDLSDAAFRAAVGIVSQALPEDQERSFARDLAAMPEAFMGYSPGRIQAAADRVGEGVAQVGRNLQRPGSMPTLGSNLGNVLGGSETPTANPSGRVTNPLFRNLPSEGQGETLLSFYSPLRSAVENMPIAREGSTGQTIMAYLNKRAPNTPASELRFSNLTLDPDRRYTRDEVLSEIQRDTSNFRANLLAGRDTQYRRAQRQGVSDPEVSYFEITLDNPDYTAGQSHFGQNTFAHTRSSIRQGEEGNYLLVEEFQSDALQNIENPNLQFTQEDPEFVRTEVFENLRSDLEFDSVPVNEDILRFAIADISSLEGNNLDLINWYEDTYGIRPEGVTRKLIHIDALRRSSPETLPDEAESAILDAFDDVSSRTAFQMRDMGRLEIPFNSNTQYVRNLILSNIALARREGVDRIVIPAVEEIARLRSDDFESMEAAVRALRPTYVDAVRKAVNTLNNESSGSIRVGSQPLQYRDLTQPNRVRTAPGILLDISDFDFDPQTQAARFAEGGMVDMEEQMSLFEMGGLAGESAAIDPVSGNEVPPGSLAEEVRDDVPAMLSEGEYVVPADVVRYYGVKFFEDLRGQAKSGLNDMERTGRIGGEPVDPTPGDEPLTPEEMAMLQEIAGMAQGGMVKGYQTGGSVDAPFTPTPNYNIPGFSLFSPLQGGTPTPTTEAQTQSVTLYGPSCEVVTLSLPNEQASYDSFVQQGYSTQPRDYCMAAVEREQAGDDGGEPGGYFGSTSGDSGRDYQPLDPDMYAELRDDPLGFGAAALEGRDLTRLLGGIGIFLNPILGLAGGAAGAAITARNVAQAQAAVEVARAKGLDTSALEAQIEEYISNLPNATRIAANIFADGTRIAQRFFQTARDMGLDPNVYGPNPLTREWFETDEAFNQAMEDSAPEGMSYDSDSGSYVREGSAAPTSSIRPTMRPGERPRATQPPAAPRVAPVSQPTATGVTTPEVYRTILPTETQPEDIPTGSDIVGEMATPEEAAAPQGGRRLTEGDIALLNGAGVGMGDAQVGDRATPEEQAFLAVNPTTPMSTQPGQFYTPPTGGTPKTPTLPTDSIPTATQRYFDQFGLPTPNVPTLVGYVVDGTIVNDPATGSPRYLRAGEPFVDFIGKISVDPRIPQQTTPSPSPAVNTANLPAFAATDRDGVVVRDPVTGQVRRASPGESYRNLDGTVGTVPGGTPTTTSVIPSLDQQVTEAFGMTPKPTTPVNLAGTGMLPPPTRSTTTQPPNLMGTTAFNTTLPPSFSAPMGDLEAFVAGTPTRPMTPYEAAQQRFQASGNPVMTTAPGSLRPTGPAGSIPTNTVTVDPRTNKASFFDTTTQFSTPSGGYSWNQPGFTPNPSYQAAMDRLNTGQTPKPSTPADLRGPGMLPPTPTRSTPSVGYGPGQIDPRLARAVESRDTAGLYNTIYGPGSISTTTGAVATTPEMKRELLQNMGIIQVAGAAQGTTDRARARPTQATTKPEPIVSRPTPRPSPAPTSKPSAPPPREESDKPAPSTTKQGSQVSRAEADRIRSEKESGGGGDSGGGGGKIVCTAMNEAYGFGSYRQAVWLKYSQDNLTPYHEKGYHKIFLPLVDRAYNRGEKNNLFLRKVLENIARHRTADLRAEMQGKKRDKLGRAYRFILEPVCYLVGRFSK